MVNRMYWITALVCGIFIALLLYSEIIAKVRPNKKNRSYRLLLSWGVFFCLQDVIWGILTCHFYDKPTLIFIASTIFHLSTVTTTYFWLNCALIYLEDKVKHPSFYRSLGIMIVVFQSVLLAVNCFTPTIFFVNAQGQYCAAAWRMFAFSNQYIVYLITGIIAFVCYLHYKRKERQFLAVTASALAPILTGYFQYCYPYEPFYSIGYTASCLIAYAFIVTEERKALAELYLQKQLKAKQQQIVEQKALAKEDRLTQVYNRLAYEEDMKNEAMHTKPNFVYASIDINSLKEMNDSLGHEAGDEIIKGAAFCIKQSLEAYGKVYRIGGDEFVALINADPETVELIKKSLNDTVQAWRGRLVDKIAVSVGFASRDEYPYVSGEELAHIADLRMYEDKERYYQQLGMDRRGRSAAVTALSKLYAKILKINLTTDSYQLIRMEEDEKLAARGFSDKISVWMYKFAISGNVYEEDVAEYLAKTDMDFLRQYFAKGNKSLSINYRRRIKDEYKPTFMLLIPADDYSEENQSLFLYVCEVFR